MKKNVKFEIPCVILSGGKSSRMGKDKSLLPFGGFPTLAEYQYNRLTKLFENVYISCKEDSKFGFEAQFIRDDSSIFAPSVGIKQAFNALKSKEIFFITIDTPFLRESTIMLLVQSARENPDSHAVLIQSGEKRHYLLGIYRSAILPKIKHHLAEKNYRISALLCENYTKYITLQESDEFCNLNTQAEYEHALGLGLL